MSSRFFHGGSSGSSEYSDSSEDYTASDEEILSSGEENEIDNDDDQRQQQQQVQKQSAFSKFLRDEDESSDDDSSTRRVVRSGKEKFEDEVRDCIHGIDNGKKINDWVSIQNHFDKMMKAVQKASATIIRDSGLPKFFLKSLADLDAFLAKVTEDKKKMNANNAKAFAAVKQKIRKAVKTYQSEIDDFNKKGGAVDEVDNEPAKSAKYSESDSELSESSQESSAERGPSRWLKSTSAKSTDAKVKKSTPVARPKMAVSESEDDAGFVQVGKEKSQAKAELVISGETVAVRLREALEARGKKGTDRAEQIEILNQLLLVCKNPVQKVKILLTLISARFDFSLSGTSYHTLEMLKLAEAEICQVFDILENNSSVILSEHGEGREEDREYKPAEQVYAIRGNIVSMISRLDDEFTKSLQNTDPHTMEYIDRLKDEVSLYGLIARAQNYCTARSEVDNVVFLKIMRLEHVYYKYNHVTRLFEEKIRTNNPKLGPAPASVDQLVHDICVYLYQHAPDRVRTRAVLCHVYHHALNKRFVEARDLLLMSHLQETIHQTDVPTQVLYNRALVQIGICAFRNGLIREAHNALNDVMASLKAKDILAQGTQLAKYQATDLDKKDKQKTLPFHMHINLEMLEAIQLIVSMLLEVSNMAAFPHDTRRKIISKHFRRLYEQSENQIFNGPPENFKDYIMQASRALSKGNWKLCRKLIGGVKPLDLIPESNTIREMLSEKIQIEGLRTFLFTYGSQFKTIALKSLVERFEIPESKIYSVVSKMILNEELYASIDRNAGLITLYHIQRNRTEFLASQYADKLTLLLEANESLFDLKHLKKTDESLKKKQPPMQTFGSSVKRPIANSIIKK